MSEVDGRPQSIATFAGWLHRPFVDLGPSPSNAPFQTLAVDFDFCGIDDPTYPRLQGSYNPSFRETLLAAPQLARYRVDEPEDLPEDLRTDRWDQMCRHLVAFETLEKEAATRLLWLVSKLCFYELVVALTAPSALHADDRPDAAYLYAWSRYRMWLDDGCDDYSLAEFEQIAVRAPVGFAKIDAAYQMVVQNAKFAGSLDECVRWQKAHRNALDAVGGVVGEFAHAVLESRFWRVGAFVPQMQRDAAGVADQMARAVDIARALPRRSGPERVAADEILYPALESRMKEHVWLGDLDSALEFATEYVALSPLDARGWMHQGDVLSETEEFEAALGAYRQAARFAPPGAEIALFMAGQCLEQLGDLRAAAEYYERSLGADPQAISAAQRLLAVARALGDGPTANWADSTLRALQRQQQEGNRQSLSMPYRSIASPRT